MFIPQTDPMNRPHAATQALVIGGGPAGSTAATLLAREGFEVTLLERQAFPRYHIGESLLPSMLQIFDLLGVRDTIESHGFQRKPGAYLEWGNESWALDFGELTGERGYSFQVIRSEFDQLLLEHAKGQGVRVYEGVGVDSLSFDGERPRAAAWSRGDGSQRGEIRFDVLIDASGRRGLMATRYLRNRRHHEAFRNIALWGYWEGANRLDAGREGAIAVGSIPEGWLWAIPLHDGTMSVGVVMHKTTYATQRPASQEDIYHAAIAACPLVADLVAPGRLVSPVQADQDYSYDADRFAGPGYYLCGDAACFVDPLLSSGVHLASVSALMAAASAASVLRGEVGAEQAAAFYDKSYRHAYLRFLVFVSAFYDQYRGKESYFWEAQRLTRHDYQARDLKGAFLSLVSGVEDLSDVEDAVPALVVGEMKKRVADNVALRRDKATPAVVGGKDGVDQPANVAFFDAVEGLFSLSAQGAVDGLYVATTPRLGLAHVAESRRAAVGE